MNLQSDRFRGQSYARRSRHALWAVAMCISQSVSSNCHQVCCCIYSWSLLCREREGIPANILGLLDHTVEIEQLGIIRSLNVHVSGAISIYAYSQQWGFQTAAQTAR